MPQLSKLSLLKAICAGVFLALIVVVARMAVVATAQNSTPVIPSAPTTASTSAATGPITAPAIGPATGSATGPAAGSTTGPVTINVSSMGTPRTLAWDPNTTQIAWYATSGQPVALATGYGAKAVILPCGIAPGGDHFILYQGGTTAQPFIYPMGSGSSVALGSSIGLACALRGRVAYSPDGTMLGLIQYPAKITNNNYTAGMLRILKTPDGAEQHAASNVNSFDLQNDGALLMEFFANTNGEANSADLIFWDAKANRERKLEEGIKPLENCQFVSARVLRDGDKVYSLLGERCKGSLSAWRVLRTDFAGGNSANLASGPTGAGGGALYFNSAASNELLLLPDGKQLLIAVPNGLSADIVNLMRVSLADGSVSDVISNVVVDLYPPAMPRRFLLSPKGDRLAFVTRDGNQSEALYSYDLTKPTVDPVLLAGGGRSDHINAVAWTMDGSRLYYVIVGSDNGLLYVTSDGKAKRVVRGIFQGLAISSDGSTAAVSEQVKVADNDLRNNLIQVNVDVQSKVTLLEGGKGDSTLVPFIVVK